MSFPVDHRVPACAYVIVGSERTLLAKYRKLSSQQISALAGQGEQVAVTSPFVFKRTCLSDDPL